MRKFVLRLVGTGFVALILLETILRIFSMAGHPRPTANIDGDYLLRPGETGYWIRGSAREIVSHYTINPQGWNSTRDYAEDLADPQLIKNALIGDSYIEGFHVNTAESIAVQIEQRIGNNYIFHEFGRAEANLVDYAEVYNKFGLADYCYVFVLVNPYDLVGQKAAFMGRGDRRRNDSLIRTFYRNCATMRYLNINLGLNEVLRKLFRTTSERGSKTSDPQQINTKALEKFGSNTIFLYEKEKMPDAFLRYLPDRKLQIEHELKPIDFGFDVHWNLAGRINCAKTIANYISTMENIEMKNAR